MQLRHIKDIQKTCDEFMKQVLDLDDVVDKDTLLSLLQRYCDGHTEQGDDTIDVDYKNMCFTFQKLKGNTSTDDKDWLLCENATYYIFRNNLGLTEVEDAIDIELD